MNVPDGKKDFVLRFPEIFIEGCLEKVSKRFKIIKNSNHIDLKCIYFHIAAR